MNLIVPILEVLSVFLCINRIWPKGIVHGEHEDWEKEYRSNKRGFGSPKTSGSKGRRESGASGRSRTRRESEGRVSDREVHGRGGPMYDPRLSGSVREDRRHSRNVDDDFVYPGREKRGSVGSRGYGSKH